MDKPSQAHGYLAHRSSGKHSMLNNICTNVVTPSFPMSLGVIRFPTNLKFDHRLFQYSNSRVGDGQRLTMIALHQQVESVKGFYFKNLPMLRCST